MSLFPFIFFSFVVFGFGVFFILPYINAIGRRIEKQTEQKEIDDTMKVSKTVRFLKLLFGRNVEDEDEQEDDRRN